MMKITIQCECSNSAVMQVKNGKAFVVRDNLERDNFYCTENGIKEILLKCNKCNNWIIFDMN